MPNSISAAPFIVNAHPRPRLSNNDPTGSKEKSIPMGAIELSPPRMVPTIALRDVSLARVLVPAL